MIDTYQQTDEKEWLEATVTIDGEVLESADPTDLPWLIRLDKFIDDNQVDGWSELIVRSNGTDARLRLVVQNLDEEWKAENFSTDGLLYFDGPGNNSYLRWDAETGGFTVVAWDHILDQWVQVLTEQAGDLVDADTVHEEADAIREVIGG